MDLWEYKKRFSDRERERETEDNRETDPILEGFLPLHRHGGHGLEGELSSHLGGRPRKKKKKEEGSPPSLPVARSATGARIVIAIYINNLATIITNSVPLFSAVQHPFSRCNLYLNMMLNSIYYFPMIFGYPMMFE